MCQSGATINSNTQRVCAHVDAEYHRNHSALFVLELDEVFLLAGKDEGMRFDCKSPEIILQPIHNQVISKYSDLTALLLTHLF